MSVKVTNNIEKFFDQQTCYTCLQESNAKLDTYYEFGLCNELYSFNLTADVNTMKNGKLVSLKLSSMVQYYVFNSAMMLIICVFSYIFSIRLLVREKGELIMYVIQAVCYGCFFIESYTALSASLVYSLAQDAKVGCYILGYPALYIVFCKIMLFVLFASNFASRLVPERYKRILYVCEIISAFALCFGAVINIAYTEYAETSHPGYSTIIIINFICMCLTIGFYQYIKKN